MKVHVVTAFDAEPYEHGSWVHKVFFNLSDTIQYVNDCHNKVFGEDQYNLNYGYMISRTISTQEVL